MDPYTDIIIHPLASSTRETHYLLFYNGQYYEVSHPIVELVTELQQKSTQKEAISSYMRKRKENIQ